MYRLCVNVNFWIKGSYSKILTYNWTIPPFQERLVINVDDRRQKILQRKTTF